MKKIILFFIILLSLPIIGLDNNIKNSIVKIFTIYNNPNYYQPWQTTGQTSTTGSGCIIDNNLILTNAHIVSNQTFIEVRKFGNPNKYIARLVAVGHECDLAILTVDDTTFFENTKPLSIGELPALQDKVAAYGFPIGGDKLSITEGIVSRIELQPYTHSQRYLLTVQLDAAINPGNSGGPIIKDGKIVGVAFQGLQSADNIGYMVPTPVIQHFFHDIKDGYYDGFPFLGIKWQQLENNSHRDYLNLDKDYTGIKVNHIIYNSSAYGYLLEDDVILRIDDIPIANDGTIGFLEGERINFSYTYLRKYVGDNIIITLFRDGKIHNLNITLKGYMRSVPNIQYDVDPEYYIIGGFVFISLTYNYLRLWGKNSPVRLWYKYYYNYPTPVSKEVVVLQMVLADKINRGYHSFRNMVVETLNGESIYSLKEFINKIEQINSGYIKINFENDAEIIIDAKKAKSANKAILKRYRIPADRHLN